jgi:peptidoglycan hydrolase-like protein with peptidoglycan-binding domain
MRLVKYPIFFFILFGLIFNSFSFAATSGISCPSIKELKRLKTPLQFRQRNTSVKTLQQALACLGYLKDEKNINSFFGKKTRQALKEFYQDRNLRINPNRFTLTAKTKLIETIVSPPQSLPTTCVDQEGGVPVITSISPTSGSVGTKIEIKGCNFIGFEGDLDAVLVRSDGKEIPLYGGTWYPEYGGEAGKGKIMIVTVQPYCVSGYETGRYSGITSPCQTIQITPGIYKIYVTAWGKKSNSVTFIVK